MAPLVLPLVKALTEAEYQVFRDAQGVGFAPAPPPEHRPVLADWKEALAHALVEGERAPAQELLRLERLAALLLAREGIPALTWCTFYSEDRPEPERVLAPGENLLAHLRWRARNLPAPRRVHLASTDAALTLDLEAPLEAFLRVLGAGRVELYGWPELRMRIYLEAAARGRGNPHHLVLERRAEVLEGHTWADLLRALMREVA